MGLPGFISPSSGSSGWRRAGFAAGIGETLRRMTVSVGGGGSSARTARDQGNSRAQTVSVRAMWLLLKKGWKKDTRSIEQGRRDGNEGVQRRRIGRQVLGRNGRGQRIVLPLIQPAMQRHQAGGTGAVSRPGR